MLTLRGCSLTCAYATSTSATCTCQCGGRMHGSMVPEPVLAKCSPAAEKRCKEGNESGDCACACGGANHGLYQHIPDFESSVRITTYA